MADGIEVRGNSLRVLFSYKGRRYRPKVAGGATPENIARTKRLGEIIRYEIENGTFELGRHFPELVEAEGNTITHYLDLLLEIKRNSMAPSGYRAQKSKAENHIRPKWGKRQVESIDHIHLMNWVQLELMPKLHNKTVREILSILRQVFALYRTRHKSAHDPTEGIKVSMPDADEVDPFVREEIDALLAPDPEREQEINLTTMMIWTGPRISEALALAWEDVDLVRGVVKFRRSQVRSHYKVTKTRRGTREIRLLKPALDALRAQYRFTGRSDPVIVDVTDRDNKTVRHVPLRFVFNKSTTGKPWTSSEVLIKTWWAGHLAARGVRYRGPNNCRHTFASQLLTSGVVPLDWIADQMGHTSTAMIWRHYGRWINEDGPDMVGLLETALKL